MLFFRFCKRSSFIIWGGRVILNVYAESIMIVPQSTFYDRYSSESMCCFLYAITFNRKELSKLATKRERGFCGVDVYGV